jgi:hypothetical protein
MKKPLLIIALLFSVVSFAQLPKLSPRQVLGWFDVKDFGATGDGVTNDSAAVQSAINYANSHGGGVVYFPKGIYRCRISIPLHDYSNTETQVSIKLLGESLSVQNFDPFSTVDRPVNLTGSIILGNTIPIGETSSVIRSEGVGGASWTQLNFVDFSMENLTVRLRSTNGSLDIAPKDTAINLYANAFMSLKNVIVDNESMNDSLVQPASTCVGIITPAKGNWAKVIGNQVYVIGTYKGLIANEHTDFDHSFFDGNYYSIVLPDADQPIHFNTVGCWRYKYAIKVEGTTTKFVSFDQLRLERTISPVVWFDFVADLDEPTPGWTTGKINWSNVHGPFSFIRTNPTASRIFDFPFNGTSPHWSTADRPSNIADGTTGFNTTTLFPEFYDGTTWKSLGGAGGVNTQIQYNNNGALGGFGAWDGSAMSVAGDIFVIPNAGAARKISFQTGTGSPNILYYDGGATVRYGSGINSAELQYFIPDAGHISFNKGGDLQASGTNELFRIDDNGIRLPASKYINFGTTSGSSGYGIRDNAGTPQFKINGGNWTDFGSGGGGVTTMAAIGSSPNGDGASISTSTLTLQPASASFGGVVTTGAQTFEGTKTFNQNILSNGSGVFSGEVQSTYGSFTELGTQPTTPTGRGIFWAKSDGTPHYLNDAGVDVQLGGSSSSSTIATLNVNTTDVSNSGTSETDLMSYTLPAGKLVNVGDRLVIEADFSTASNANNKTLIFYFGGYTHTQSPSTIASGTTIRMRFTVIKTGTGTQKITREFLTSFSTSPGTATASVSDTGTIVIKFTGTSGTASSDITQTAMIITYYPAP